MIDPITQYILNEGYIFSDKTVSVNLDKFESGESNKLLVVGVLGSGKTSLAEYLAKKYKANLVSDTHIRDMKRGLKDSKRTILEGAQIARWYKKSPADRELIIHQPMILIGMSAIKAGLRADKRDGTVPSTSKDKRDIYISIRVNIKEWQGYLNFLRKDVMKIPNVVIKEYQVPKFKPVYY